MSDRLRVLIISDTHGRTERIDRAIAQVTERIGGYDLLLHAGDHAQDVSEQKYDPAIAVCGNCDPIGCEEEEKTIDLLGIKTLLLHGHTVRVKSTPLSLVYRAIEQNAQLTVFGHTHTPTLFVEADRVFLNPGSLSTPRGFTVCTYALLQLEREEGRTRADFSFYALDGHQIASFALQHTFSS